MEKMVNVLLCLCFCILITFSYGSRHFRFDYEYNEDAKGWFKFHHVPASFIDAFLRCKAEGAVLASPLNKPLHKAMVKLYQANSDSCGIFTGTHATFSKGDFSSIEGVPLSRMPIEWAPDEPDNHENKEDCTLMVQNGTLADVQCNDTYPYICFRKSIDNDPYETPCGTIDQGYNLDGRTGSCYKFHRTARTWRKAAMTCMAEGGHLAIINSDKEAEVIKDVFYKNPAHTISSRFRDVAAIGIYDWGERGVWYTVHGETLEEAGYSRFSNGEPNNDTSYDGGSFCGGVFRSGLLDDIWCSGVNFPFICEKKPKSLI